MDEALLFRSLGRMTSEGEEAAITRWRRASTDNESRYQELSRLFAIMANADSHRLAGTPPPRAEDIVEHSEELHSESGYALLNAPRGARLVSWLIPVAAIAAGVVVAFALWRFRPGASAAAVLAVREVVTGPSELATISLVDGSTVRLGPNSRLQVDTGEKRRIALEGHAYFAVAKQKAGPLHIRTSAGDVQVVGTRFDLETKGERLRLVVIEGRVILDAHGTLSAVTAGQMVRVREGVPGPVVELPRTMPRIEGLGNFLAFQNTPLRDAAREIERQFRVHVQVADSALGSRTITGWFSDWTLHDVLDVVCAIANAECLRSEGVVIIRPR